MEVISSSALGADLSFLWWQCLGKFLPSSPGCGVKELSPPPFLGSCSGVRGDTSFLDQADSGKSFSLSLGTVFLEWVPSPVAS